MKRIATMLCMLVLLMFSSSVFGSINQSIEIKKLDEADKEYSEIIGLDEEIKQIINSIRKGSNVSELRDDYEIDYTKANKIYVDTDIFSLETSKSRDVKRALGEGGYMWLLILNIENTTYQINISKGLPFNESVKGFLTDEEIDSIKAEEGKWSIAAIEILEGENINYEDTIVNALKDINYESYEEIVLCGGLKHIYQPVALIMNNKEVELLIPLYDLEIEGTKEQISSIKPTAAQEVDGVYLYSRIKDAVNQMKGPDEDSVGSGAYVKLYSKDNGVEFEYSIVIIMVLFIGSISIIYYRRKKNNLHRF